jgi:hypothetical protein
MSIVAIHIGEIAFGKEGRASSRRLRFARPTLNAARHGATGSATSAPTSHSGQLRAMTTLVVLRNKAIKPLLAAAQPCAQPVAHIIANPSISTSAPAKLEWPKSFMRSALLLEYRQFFLQGLSLKGLRAHPCIAFHLWTPSFRQGKTLGSLLRVVGCCHLSGL